MSTARTAGTGTGLDDEQLESRHWKWAAAASMADYIDAGSTVAAGATLAIWATYFGGGKGWVGTAGAIGAGGISTGIGALLGGRFGDVLGRKRIYQYDLLVYAIGALVVVFTVSLWQLLVGFVLIGLAFGADVPTSWSLIAEFSPRASRNRLMGLTFVFWNSGPIVTLLLSLAFTPLGVLGARLLFLHLFVVAMITWWFRRGLSESARWRRTRERQGAQPLLSRAQLATLFSNKNLAGMAFLISVYLTYNLVSGSVSSIFQPYIFKTVGVSSQAQSVALSGLGFLLGICGTGLIYMRYADRVRTRYLFGASAVIVTVSYLPFLFFGLSTTTALINVVLFGFGAGFGQEAFFRAWSAELFPTAIRNTAQGLTWGLVKVGTGVFRFFVPALAASSFRTLALIVVVLLVMSGVIGVAFAPRTRGRSFDEIDRADEAHG